MNGEALSGNGQGEVWKEAYEVVGDGIALAEHHFQECKRVGGVHWQLVEQFGAEGYRPAHNGGIRSLLFNEVPPLWRQIGRDKGRIECLPLRTLKAGKELARQISEIEKMPSEDDLLAKLGWPDQFVCDGGRVYRGTIAKLSLPATRYLIRVPRQLNDGWECSAYLRPIAMSEYIKAFEDHNEAVRALKEAA